MKLTVEQTADGIKIPLTFFAEGVQLEVVVEGEYAIVRPVVREGSRFSVDPRRAQMAREVAAFEGQHAVLAATHLGRYVAFHKGALVDADEDVQALRHRIRKQMPDAVVMIQQVQEKLPPPLRI